MTKTPKGTNSMPSKELFDQRQIYQEFAYPLDKDSKWSIPEPIDIWYDKHLYGKVDEDYNAIFLNDEFLKELPGTGGKLFAVNFVADAFEDLRNYMIASTNGNKISAENSKLAILNPKRGWFPVDNQYFQHITGIYQAYTSIFLIQNENYKEVITFKDFMKYMSLFLERAVRAVPFSRSGFLVSHMCSVAASGLMIEMSNDDHGDDTKKYNDYIQDVNFEYYILAARKFGFFVDKNAPWRLVADIKSNKMQKYMSRYPEIPDEPKQKERPELPDPNEIFDQYIGEEVQFQLEDAELIGEITEVIPNEEDLAQSTFKIKKKVDAEINIPPPDVPPDIYMAPNIEIGAGNSGGIPYTGAITVYKNAKSDILGISADGNFEPFGGADANAIFLKGLPSHEESESNPFPGSDFYWNVETEPVILDGREIRSRIRTERYNSDGSINPNVFGVFDLTPDSPYFPSLSPITRTSAVSDYRDYASFIPYVPGEYVISLRGQTNDPGNPSNTNYSTAYAVISVPSVNETDLIEYVWDRLNLEIEQVFNIWKDRAWDEMINASKEIDFQYPRRYGLVGMIRSFIASDERIIRTNISDMVLISNTDPENFERLMRIIVEEADLDDEGRETLDDALMELFGFNFEQMKDRTAGQPIDVRHIDALFGILYPKLKDEQSGSALYPWFGEWINGPPNSTPLYRQHVPKFLQDWTQALYESITRIKDESEAAAELRRLEVLASLRRATVGYFDTSFLEFQALLDGGGIFENEPPWRRSDQHDYRRTIRLPEFWSPGAAYEKQGVRDIQKLWKRQRFKNEQDYHPWDFGPGADWQPIISLMAETIRQSTASEEQVKTIKSTFFEDLVWSAQTKPLLFPLMKRKTYLVGGDQASDKEFFTSIVSFYNQKILGDTSYYGIDVLSDPVYDDTTVWEDVLQIKNMLPELKPLLKQPFSNEEEMFSEDGVRIWESEQAFIVREYYPSMGQRGNPNAPDPQDLLSEASEVITPNEVEETIVIPMEGGTRFVLTEGGNRDFRIKRQDFYEAILRYDPDLELYNTIRVTHEEWVEEKNKIEEFITKYGKLSFDNLFHRQYLKSFELDIPILKRYIVDFYNSFVRLNSEVKIVVINKCTTGTRTYMKGRNYITEGELNSLYPDAYWIDFYAKLRLMEAGHTMDKETMKNFFEGIRDLLVYDPNGITKVVRRINEQTKKVPKGKMNLTPRAKRDKIKTTINKSQKTGY